MKKHDRTTDTSMTIGSLARAAGVNVETIRYYQRIGLVEEPPRPRQGYRRYPAAIIDRIRFIKRAQELGFNLREITELLALDDGACDEARVLAEHKRDVIQARISDLSAMQTALEKLIRACRRTRDGHGTCAIIETLARSDRQ